MNGSGKDIALPLCHLYSGTIGLYSILEPYLMLNYETHLRINYQGSYDPLLGPNISFRGLVILLRALARVKHSVKEFIIKPLYSDPNRDTIDCGIS